MEQIVTGCRDCPLCQNQDYSYFCNHPNYEDKGLQLETTDNLIPITPENCPLNEDKITITKQQ